MNRQKFIDTFNEYFEEVPSSRLSDSFFRTFDLDVTEYDNPSMHLTVLKAIFKPFFEHLGQESLIDKKWFEDLNFYKEYDYYFEEDNPDSDICKFNMGINLHYLYDELALKINNDIKLVDIYRIETIDGKTGLYGDFISRDLFDECKQPNPLDDSQLKDIFSTKLKNETYKRKWSFAFESLKHAHDWMETEDLHSLLNHTNLAVKKITLPESFVIYGNKQAIFQKQYVLTETICNLLPRQKTPKI